MRVYRRVHNLQLSTFCLNISILVPADQFRFTSEGNAIVIKGVNDAQQFLETREALTLLGLFE